MKQVIAYIRPSSLELVTEGLKNVVGLAGMSAMGNSGFGRGKDSNCKRVDSQINRFSRNVRFEIMVTDDIVWDVVDTIRQQALTDQKGEGKIYVLDVVEAVQIRTKERGEAAV